MAAGVLLLLFVAYELWGTGLHEAQAQHKLTQQLDATLATTSVPPPTTTKPGPTSTLPAKTAPAKDLAPDIGEPMGRIEIPKLNLNKIVVQGVSLIQLDRAPGHYPETPFPGQAGNASIAGHRTTYGAPFYFVDKLNAGDKIIVTTVQGRFTYSVLKVFIVQPDEVWVLDTVKDHPNTLTLTACHPRFDLTQRIVVQAVLDGKPVPHLPGQDAKAAAAAKHPASLADGTATTNRGGAMSATIWWGLASAGVWAAAWLVSWRLRRGASSHRRLRRWLPYAVALPFFGVLLFIFYENLAQVVPAGL